MGKEVVKVVDIEKDAIMEMLADLKRRGVLPLRGLTLGSVFKAYLVGKYLGKIFETTEIKRGRFVEVYVRLKEGVEIDPEES